MTGPALPEPFSDLEPYLPWSLPTERERMVRRKTIAMDEIIDFHGEMSKRLEDIIVYLNQYPYAEMPEDAQRLCDMALSLVEVSNLVEMYKNLDLMNMVDADRFRPVE